MPPGALPRELDLAVHAASPCGPDDAAYRAAYSDGPRNLLGALAGGGQRVRRFVFVSSTGVYGQGDGEWVDETSPTEPERDSGRRLLEGERVALDGPFPAVVPRLAGIYGPGRVRSMERALEVPAEGPLYSNRIHRDDCAGVLRHLMLLDDPAPLYVGADSEPADRRVVAEWLADRLGVEPRYGSEGSTRTNKRCSNARLLASGYRFLYPTFREGYAALLEEGEMSTST